MIPIIDRMVEYGGIDHIPILSTDFRTANI